MFGHGWPEGVVEFGAGAVLDGVEGVVVVDGVVVVFGVDWVDVVPVVPVDPLGAAAAPAMPATAPPVASAPTTMTALIVFALFMGTSCVVGWGAFLRHPSCAPSLSGPQRLSKAYRRSSSTLGAVARRDLGRELVAARAAGEARGEAGGDAREHRAGAQG